MGMAFGLVVAWDLRHLIEGFLYEISPADPLTLAGIPMLLVVTALLACAIPARRATKIQPFVALRAE
jgi:putative ABC transport system permease protein